MADESNEIVRRARVRARLCLLLAGVSCVVFVVFLVLLNRSVQQDPLGPLRDVRFSVVGVGINFALALGSVAAFGYWRRVERARAARPMHGQGAEHAQPDRDCAVPHRHRQHAADHALGRTPNAFAFGILCSRQLYHRHAERAGDRRRLHVRLDDPRRRRPRIHRQLRCCAVHRRAARRLHRHAAVHRGAAAQSRALHRAGGRRIALPRAQRARIHRRRSAGRHDLLFDRADGRCRSADRDPARRSVCARGGRRRDAHDVVRRVRRHARDDLGADHQGSRADRRRGADGDPDVSPGRLRHRLAVLDRPCADGYRVHRQPNRRAEFAVLDAVARPRAVAGRLRTAARADAILHRARCAAGAPLDRGRDGAHRRGLPDRAVRAQLRRDCVRVRQAGVLRRQGRTCAAAPTWRSCICRGCWAATC